MSTLKGAIGPSSAPSAERTRTMPSGSRVKVSIEWILIRSLRLAVSAQRSTDPAVERAHHRLEGQVPTRRQRLTGERLPPGAESAKAARLEANVSRSSTRSPLTPSMTYSASAGGAGFRA